MTSSPAPAELLPHVPPMVLIDKITSWDHTTVVCSADSHLHQDNPLRINGRLSAHAGIEYAAQAMAAHAKLRAGETGAPRRGVVATASKVVAHVDTLDAVPAPLSISATRIADNGDSSLYEFRISAAEQLLLEGQLMVLTIS